MHVRSGFWSSFATFGLAFTPQLTNAAISCTGTPNEVLLYADGSLNVRGPWRQDFTYLCSTSGNWGTMSTEICLAWYAMLAKAAADGKTGILWYETTATCATLPTYRDSPQPVYVGLMRP